MVKFRKDENVLGKQISLNWARCLGSSENRASCEVLCEGIKSLGPRLEFQCRLVSPPSTYRQMYTYVIHMTISTN
jgi:hypothetical protein